MVTQNNEYFSQSLFYFLNGFLFPLDQIISAWLTTDISLVAGCGLHSDFFPWQHIRAISCPCGSPVTEYWVRRDPGGDTVQLPALCSCLRLFLVFFQF